MVMKTVSGCSYLLGRVCCEIHTDSRSSNSDSVSLLGRLHNIRIYPIDSALHYGDRDIYCLPLAIFEEASNANLEQRDKTHNCAGPNSALFTYPHLPKQA